MVARRLLLGGAAVAAIGLGAIVAAVVSAQVAPPPDVPPPPTTTTATKLAATPVSPPPSAQDEPAPDRVAPEAGTPPDELVRSDIVAAMERARPRVMACWDLYAEPGVAVVKMNVLSSGRVQSAKVEGELAETQTAACIEAAARAAGFRSFKRPSLSVTWQFVLKAAEEE